jgi:hypothetical protein
MYINLYKIYNLYWHTWKFGGDRLSCFGVVAMSKKDVNSTFVENISSVLLTSRNITPGALFHFTLTQNKQNVRPPWHTSSSTCGQQSDNASNDLQVGLLLGTGFSLISSRGK